MGNSVQLCTDNKVQLCTDNKVQLCDAEFWYLAYLCFADVAFVPQFRITQADRVNFIANGGVWNNGAGGPCYYLSTDTTTLPSPGIQSSGDVLAWYADCSDTNCRPGPCRDCNGAQPDAGLNFPDQSPNPPVDEYPGENSMAYVFIDFNSALDPSGEGLYCQWHFTATIGADQAELYVRKMLDGTWQAETNGYNVVGPIGSVFEPIPEAHIICSGGKLTGTDPDGLGGSGSVPLYGPSPIDSSPGYFYGWLYLNS